MNSVLDFATPEQADAILCGTSTDDTAIIQAAVDASVGKRLHFPAGVYRVNGAPDRMPWPTRGGIMVPSNTEIVLDRSAVIKVLPNAHAKHFCFNLIGVENVSIEGGTIVGDREAHTYQNVFQTLARLNANDYSTKDSYCADPTEWAEGAVAYVYQDSAANNGTYTRTAGAWVRTAAAYPNYITHEFGFGIHIHNSRNVWVNRVTVRDFTGDGIFIGRESTAAITAPTRNIFITNCVLEGHRRQGVSIVQGDNVVIDGCVFRNIGKRQNMQDGCAPRSGVDIESGGLSKSFYVTVTNNVFHGCVGASVINYDGNHVVIANNVADTSIGYGFGVNTTISGNVLNNARINGSEDRVQIPFTYAHADGVATLTMASPHGLQSGDREYFEFLDALGRVERSGTFEVARVSANVLTVDLALPAASGAGRQKYSSKNLSITGNTITAGGIRLNGSGISVIGNKLTGAGGDSSSIYLGPNCRRVKISGNSIESADQHGISGAAGYMDVSITDNAIGGIRSPSGFGINASGTRTFIEGNTITNAAGGIKMVGVSAVIRGNYIDLTAFPSSRWDGEILAACTAHCEIADNTIVAPANCGISVHRKALVKGNTVAGFTGQKGITVTGADASGTKLIGNVVSSNRESSSVSTGIVVTAGANNCRMIGNTIHAENAALAHAVNTSAVTGSVITNNVHDAAITSAAGDALAGNVAF